MDPEIEVLSTETLLSLFTLLGWGPYESTYSPGVILGVLETVYHRTPTRYSLHVGPPICAADNCRLIMVAAHMNSLHSLWHRHQVHCVEEAIIVIPRLMEQARVEVRASLSSEVRRGRRRGCEVV